MAKIFTFNFILNLVLTLPLLGVLNLERNVQDFILETKQIILPEYPKAFNPSIVRWKGEIWMSFRFFPDPNDVWVAGIGMVKLNELFEPVGPSYILNFLDHSQAIIHSLEDGRLITSGEQLFIVYNDHHEPDPRWLRRVCCAELDFNGENFYCKKYDIFLSFEGENRERQEKNWTPFSYQNQVLFSYSLNPHLIMRPLSRNACHFVCTSKANFQWEWGEVRGGTPALLLNGEYFAFYHSMCKLKTVHSKGKSMLHYFMGAYTFSAKPPFSITRISKDPIVGQDFYKPQNHYYWSPRRVVYPCGVIADENFIWVSYGREDREMWVAKMDRKQLLDSLVPVSH